MDYVGAEFGPAQGAKAARDAAFFRGCRRVLDLGCGPGHFLALLRDQGTAAYGVDHDAACLAALKARGLEASRGDALAHLRRLESGRVDGIRAVNLLEHLPVARARALLGQSARALPRGGRLLLSTSNAACLGVVAGAFWDDEQHVRPYTARLLRSWARSAGLEVLGCGPDEHSRPGGPHRRALRALRRAMVGPFFEAPELLLTALKPSVAPGPPQGGAFRGRARRPLKP